MAVIRADEAVRVTFRAGDGDYPIDARRGQIVHELFHAALPPEMTGGQRLTFRTEAGAEVFADNFIGDIVDHLGAATLLVEASPIPERPGEWRNVGFDHLAITVADRDGARDFLRDVLLMQVMRDDAHLTVMATGPTAIFLFDAGQSAPLSTGEPSSWHHIGFVVDDIAAAYAHLRRHRDRLMSDFTMLERDERWSLYFFYKNCAVTLMFQLSEIKQADRGFVDPRRKDFPNLLYDYASRPYGLQWGADADPNLTD